MEKEQKRISDFFDELCEKFSSISLKCEFYPNENSYVVDRPSSFENNDTYLEMEYDFCEKFENDFSDVEIFFVSSDPIFQVDNPFLERSNKIIEKFESECICDFQFSNTDSQWVSVSKKLAKAA